MCTHAYTPLCAHHHLTACSGNPLGRAERGHPRHTPARDGARANRPQAASPCQRSGSPPIRSRCDGCSRETGHEGGGPQVCPPLNGILWLFPPPLQQWTLDVELIPGPDLRSCFASTGVRPLDDGWYALPSICDILPIPTAARTSFLPPSPSPVSTPHRGARRATPTPARTARLPGRRAHCPLASAASASATPAAWWRAGRNGNVCPRTEWKGEAKSLGPAFPRCGSDLSQSLAVVVRGGDEQAFLCNSIGYLFWRVMMTLNAHNTRLPPPPFRLPPCSCTAR